MPVQEPTIQEPLVQATLLVCVPQPLEQVCVSEGFDPVQPCSMQEPHAPHAPPLQLALQVLVCVPLVPHDCEVGKVCVGLVQVPVQEPVTQVPLLQLTLLVCMPQPLEQG